MLTVSRSNQMAPKEGENSLRSESAEELAAILAVWDAEEENNLFDPKPTLQRMSELIEAETEAYLKRDPDPFDDRHPSRTHPNSNFGHLLKVLFRNEEFMTRLVVTYMLSRVEPDLNTVAARLLLDCVPGLDSSVVFQETEDFVAQLYRWAESADDPLRSYSIGLLAAAMEVGDIASSYHAHNVCLIPIILARLKHLACSEDREDIENSTVVHDYENNIDGPFANLKQESFENGHGRPALAEAWQ